MTIAEALDRIEAMFTRHDDEGSMAELAAMIQRVAPNPEERDAAVTALVGRFEQVDPVLAARMALGAGALVENGASPVSLSRALVQPLRRSFARAHRLLDLAQDLCDNDYEGEDAIVLGSGRCSPAQLEGLAAKDADAVNAWSSLDAWFRAAVAAWAREISVLKKVQTDAELLADLEVHKETEGGHWLSLLVQAALDDRFVILFPETREAWSFTAEGVTDNGQLTVLLSEALAAPLARIHASGVAPDEALAVMRGDGPQEIDGVYSSSFHLYPWQAFDPSDGMPADRRFTWRAPGGCGSHSLPADYQPRAIDPLDGVRVMLIIGPNQKRTLGGIREIGLARLFGPLRARLDDVRQLSVQEERRWTERVREAVKVVS